MNKTLSVSAIHNGTVIDHIKQGNALRIIQLLSLLRTREKITVGLNLPSKRLGLKDLVKIEGWEIAPHQANEVVIFAPEATINIVKNFEVIQKVKTRLPANMAKVFTCPNPACISNDKHIDTLFYIEEQNKQVNLICHHCEKVYDRDNIKVKI